MDVYSDWVDACDAVAKDTANQYDAPNPSQQRGISKQGIPEETGQGDGYDDDEMTANGALRHDINNN